MMLSINNDLHWSPEVGKDEAGASVKITGGGAVRRRKRRRLVLTSLDWTLALVVLSPLCIFYWRGLWQLLDLYLQMDLPWGLVMPYSGRYLSLLLGYLLTFICNATQRQVTAVIVEKNNRIVWRLLLSRCYTLLFAVGLVNLWRGVWQLLDLYFTSSWFSGAGSAAVGCWALASLRALRNIGAPPVVINTDHMDQEYTCSPTMFQTLVTKKSVWFFLFDVSFSVFVVASLVVFVWRGIWTVMDRLLFPSTLPMSCWMSLAIGYIVVFISYLLQKPFASTSKKFDFNCSRILFEDLYYLFASFGAISLWRGVWLFADIYIWPDDKELSNWLTMVVGLVGLLLLGAGNTLLAKGVYIDGAEKDGSGCIFSTQYLRKFFKDEIEVVVRMDDGHGPTPSMATSNSQVSRLLTPDGNHHVQNVLVEVVVERETVL